MEPVVGVAVMCEDKANFIARIFHLSNFSQTILKALVEQVMSRTVDLNGEPSPVKYMDRQEEVGNYL